MNFRVYVLSSIAIGATALMSASARSLLDFSLGTVDPTTLEPSGSFSIPGASSGKFASAEIGDGTVWFVTLRADVVHVERTDSTGRVQNTMDVPRLGYPSGYCVSQDSRFGLMYESGVIKVYLPGGDLLENIGANASRGVQCVFPYEGELVGVSRNELLRYERGSVASIKPSRMEGSDAPIITLPLSGNRVGVIDTVTARLSAVGVRSEVIENIELTAPDIQGVQRSPDMLAIFSAVVDPASRDVFVAIGPYNARSGAMILRFSEGGLLKARFRCMLPIDPVLKSDRMPSGQFVFQQIAVTADTLLLVSRSQAYCFYYKIPK